MSTVETWEGARHGKDGTPVDAAKEAVAAWERKHGTAPNVLLVNQEDLPAMAMVAGFTIRTGSVARGTVLAGRSR